MSTKKKILFIINPISGIGRQKTIETLVPKLLDNNKFESNFAYTKAPKYATTLARNAAPDYDIIVAVGGDGTIHEVANGLRGTKTAMGIIPTGSGNGFARHLGIPLSVKKAISHINYAKIHPVDMIECNDHQFINVAGVGFDALVAHQFASYGKRGFWPYFKIIMRNAFTYKTCKYLLTSNGHTTQVDAFMISIANSSQFGFDTRIAPAAEVNDGVFDVTVIQKFRLWHVPSLAWCLLRGKVQDARQVVCIKSTEMRIELIEKDLCREVHFDGDPFLIDMPLHIKILPSALTVVF